MTRPSPGPCLGPDFIHFASGFYSGPCLFFSPGPGLHFIKEDGSMSGSGFYSFRVRVRVWILSSILLMPKLFYTLSFLKIETYTHIRVKNCVHTS